MTLTTRAKERCSQRSGRSSRSRGMSCRCPSRWTLQQLQCHRYDHYGGVGGENPAHAVPANVQSHKGAANQPPPLYFAL